MTIHDDEEDLDDDDFDDSPKGPPPPTTWIEGAKATRWGRWDPSWPLETFRDIQVWGDSHCCRFILVSESDSTEFQDRKVTDHYLVLYIAPKPNRLSTGLCEHSIANRDRNAPNFKAWFEGYLAGKSVLTLGQTIRVW
jgi:hypothetical protein